MSNEERRRYEEYIAQLRVQFQKDNDAFEREFEAFNKRTWPNVWKQLLGETRAKSQ